MDQDRFAKNLFELENEAREIIDSPFFMPLRSPKCSEQTRTKNSPFGFVQLI